MLPKSSYGMTVQNCVHPSDWNRLKSFIEERANFKCECCDDKGPLDAHERWSYNEEEKTQKLMRIIAICKPCHETTHMGLAQINGREEAAFDRLMQVRKMDKPTALKHLEDATKVKSRRDDIEWKQDFSILTDSGIRLVENIESKKRKFSEDESTSMRSSLLGNLSAQLGIYKPSIAPVLQQQTTPSQLETKKLTIKN